MKNISSGQTDFLISGNRAKMGVDSVLFVDNSSIDYDPNIELLSISEVTEFLKLSASAVRRLQQGRHLTFFKVGGSVRFAKSDILSFLAKNRVPSID